MGGAASDRRIPPDVTQYKTHLSLNNFEAAISCLQAIPDEHLKYLSFPHHAPLRVKRALLARGKHLSNDEELRCNGTTLLHRAIEMNFLEQFEVLVSARQVNLNIKNEHGKTPLALIAKFYRAQQFLKLLLSQDPSRLDLNAVDNQNNTPLHLSMREGNARAFKLLYVGGADDLLKNDSGETCWEIKTRFNITHLHSGLEIWKKEMYYLVSLDVRLFIRLSGWREGNRVWGLLPLELIKRICKVLHSWNERLPNKIHSDPV